MTDLRKACMHKHSAAISAYVLLLHFQGNRCTGCSDLRAPPSLDSITRHQDCVWATSVAQIDCLCALLESMCAIWQAVPCGVWRSCASENSSTAYMRVVCHMSCVCSCKRKWPLWRLQWPRPSQHSTKQGAALWQTQTLNRHPGRPSTLALGGGTCPGKHR